MLYIFNKIIELINPKKILFNLGKFFFILPITHEKQAGQN
jgi:hypothetical protein